nr:retrovirus-related Pol polyprotein from transposon TNT 1-94 [Tanacetum cinerariifolium]
MRIMMALIVKGCCDESRPIQFKLRLSPFWHVNLLWLQPWGMNDDVSLSEVCVALYDKEPRRKDKQISSSREAEVLLVKGRSLKKDTDKGCTVTDGDRTLEVVKLCHVRLGHAGEQSLNLLIKQGLLKGPSSQNDWLDDIDEEIDEQELEAHYSFMAKIQKVLTVDLGYDVKPLEKVQSDNEYNVFATKRHHSEQPESTNDTYLVEKVDNKSFLIHRECNTALEKCKSSLEESNRTRDRYLGALHYQEMNSGPILFTFFSTAPKVQNEITP